MGGKTKQSQRTKNNVRPSSSGRSALLLNNVKLESGVMNIAGTELPALFPTLVAPNIDPLISPELQLCIKKLNKKDPITKTKALQELSELVTNCKVDDVVAVLPNWAHSYKILTADPDRKVREATQWCHGCIVSVCGRRIAPQLKQLMGAWLQAQGDEHAPAHTHAANSLHKTFPDSKLPEVISFCKSEVVTHLVDNLVGTGESAFVRKTDSVEEKEAQSVRIVSSALGGLQYTAQHLPRAHDAWLWGRLAPLLHHASFWKRAAHPDNRIRAAWYALVGQLILRYKGQFAEQFGQKTLRILLAAAECNPLAAAQLWDCVLLFIYNVQEWHKYLDKNELLNKRILDVLENGGWGDARHLCNILLPLLAHLPDNMLSKHFYNNFFNAIFNGLDKKTILSSKSERQSWITSLEECLRYLSTQSHDYVPEVVTSVHRTWLSKVLADSHDGQIRTNLIKHSASSMAALVKYWLKQAKEGQSEVFDQLIRNFWQNVGSTLTTQIDKLSTNHADIGKSIDGHILLLQTLKTSFIQEAKKQQSIKFDGDAPTAADKCPQEAPRCDPSIVERYNHNLNDLVEKVCGLYLEFANGKQVSGPVLTPLITLLVEFDSKDLFVAIARQFSCEGPYKWYEQVLRRWLAGDTMRCKPVVDVVFLLKKHLTESEQDALFDSFTQFPPSVVEWCISLSLSHPHRESRAVRRWMRGALVQAAVCALCHRISRFGDCAAKSLLLMCLTQDEDGEMLINEQAISNIVEQLSIAVPQVECSALELVSTLAAQLVTTVAGPTALPLILGLFQLTVLVPRGDARLSVETWCEVRAAWQDGMHALEGEERRAARAGACALLHRHLLLREQCIELQHIEHIVSLCPYLLSYDTPQDISEIVDFTTRILDIAPTDPTLVEAFVLRHNILKGDINCPFEDNAITKCIIDDCDKEDAEEMTKENLIAYLNNCAFRTIYLRTILLHQVDEDLEDTWCNELLGDEYFVQELCNVLYEFMVVCSMFDAYAFWPHYNLIKEIKMKMDTLIVDIILKCTLKTKTHLLNALSELAATKGYYWSFARRWFEMLAKLDPLKVNITQCQICEVEAETQKENETQENLKETDSAKAESQPGGDIQNKTENLQEVGRVKGEVQKEESQNKTDSENKTEISENISENQNKTDNIQMDNKHTASGEVEILDLENLKEIVTGSGFFHTLQANDRWVEASQSSLRIKYLVMLRSVYAAHCHQPEVVGEKFISDVTSGQSDCSPDVVINAYYTHNHVMLYEKDMRDAPWSHVASNAAILDYLSELVTSRGWELAAHQWDFVTITLCHVLTSVHCSRAAWGSTKVALLARAALRLYVATERFVSGVRAGCVQRQPAPHVAHLPREWSDIFAPDLHYTLFSMLLFVLESSTGTTVTANHIAVLDALIECTRRLQWESVAAQHRAGQLALARLVAVAVAALRDPAHYAFKYLAYEALTVLLKPLVLEDAEKLAAWSSEVKDEEEDKPRPQFTLLYYDEACRRLQDVVATAVSHVRICEETCELVEFTDVHVLALSLFLLAEVMAEQCTLARGELTHHYIQIFREQKYCAPLLETALRLVPAAVLAHGQHSTPAPQPQHAALFAAVPPLHVYKYCGGEAVGALAARALALCVTRAGAGEARGWRGAAPHRHATVLDNIVHGYVSPLAVKEQFTLVQQKAAELEDTEVTFHTSTYELTCILTVEERPIELRVQLSRTHPLGLPKFQVADNAPTTNTSWLVMYMGYQNGSLLNALKMWIAGVTSKVERSAQCYICYCRLHFATGRLPAAFCYQCRNKFHTACLRKWFLSSSKSNCPLCRSAF